MGRGTIVASLLAVLIGCRCDQPPPSDLAAEAVATADDAGSAGGPSVILISLDTLRADHLGCYGHPGKLTPHLDAFAADAVLFENAFSNAPSTTPAHASFFTSMVPIHHGAFHARGWPIAEQHKTMAEILKERGYATVSYNDGAQVSADYGFGRGFDVYESLMDSAIGSRFQTTVDAATGWLERHDGGRFFMFLHTYEPHHPYEPGPEFWAEFGPRYDGDLPDTITKRILFDINNLKLEANEADKQHIARAYQADVWSTDRAFGALIAELKRRDLYDSSLIIALSDHGEELGEHGMWGWHGHELFDEQLHIPLLIKEPGGRHAGRRVGEQVRGIDLLPTVLELLDVPRLPAFEGKSVARLMAGEPAYDQRPLLAQRDVAESEVPTALRSDGWKYIWRPHKVEGLRLLFDLRNDPGEQHSQFNGENLETIKRLEIEITRLLGLRPEAAPRERVSPSRQTREQLRAMGYVPDTNNE